MKRTCAYCGMFDDDDDILVRCQGPDCSLRSADYEIPGAVEELSMVPANNISSDWCGRP